ncbi:MAG: MXAN_6640 family putative metalloprotease [Balneolales bacterium]
MTYFNLTTKLRVLIFLIFGVSLMVFLKEDPVMASVQKVTPDTSEISTGREAMLNHIESLFDTSSGMQIASEVKPARCLFPYYQLYEEVEDELSVTARQELRQLLMEPVEEDLDTLYSASGKFRILYTTAGPDSIPAADSSGSGIPDYAEWTAEFADSSYRYQVETLGFVDPTVHRGNGQECGNRTGEWQDTVITIQFKDFGYYGGFNPSRPFEFLVHSTFDGFPPNDKHENQQLGSLQVTIAHEFKHVVQYATNCMTGDAGHNAWLEMDATMMENIVHPDVNDYYNYIIENTSIFNSPAYSIPAYDDYWKSYNHVTWMLFYAEKYGMDYWVDVWDRIYNFHELPFLDAMKVELIERTDNFEASLIRNHLWHLASGARSVPVDSFPDGYGFMEREAYPNARVSAHFKELPIEPNAMVEIPLRAARYYEFSPEEFQESDTVAIAVFSDSLGAGIGLLAKMKSGEIREHIILSSESTPQKYAFPMDWEELAWLGVVNVNGNYQLPLRTELFAGSGKNIEQLSYGDITRTRDLNGEDARSILQQKINGTSLSGFEKYIGDVSGNGTVTLYDAAWIYRALEDPGSTIFPVDDNQDGKAPEWGRFVRVEPEQNTIFPEAKTGPPGSIRDTITATLRLDTTQPVVTEEMDITLSVPGASDSIWHSLFIEIAMDYPEDEEGEMTDNMVELELVDVLAHAEPEIRNEWEHVGTDYQLKFAYAASGPFNSSTNPDDLLTFRFVPHTGGNIQFEITSLELDERNYRVAHPLMDPVAVKGLPVTEPPGEKPVVFALNQNYPNPFNPETTITFSLPETASVRLQVFDITGRVVAKLVDETMGRGHHSLRFDSRHFSGLSSGIYLYRLESAGQSAVRKMMIIK